MSALVKINQGENTGKFLVQTWNLGFRLPRGTTEHFLLLKIKNYSFSLESNKKTIIKLLNWQILKNDDVQC